MAQEPWKSQAFSEWHEWLNEGQMNVKDTERSSGKHTDQIKLIYCCMECCLFRPEWHEWLNEGQMNVKDTERSSGKHTDQIKLIYCCMECCLFRQGQQSAMLIKE